MVRNIPYKQKDQQIQGEGYPSHHAKKSCPTENPPFRLKSVKHNTIKFKYNVTKQKNKKKKCKIKIKYMALQLPALEQ